MPKLDKTTANAVNSAESTDLTPLPASTYNARLQGVEVREGQKAPYWSWEFKIEDTDYNGRRIWVNTSLSTNAAWKMREVFDAFGADPDTDTDELCGQSVRLVVTQRAIETGNRAGQIGNNVDRVLPSLHSDSDDEDIDIF